MTMPDHANQPATPGQEQVAFRKYIYRAAGQPDPDDVNLFEAARMAANRFEELEERLDAIESATGINLENAEYKQLTRQAKLQKIRDALRRRAQKDPNGTAAYDYNDVLALFDDHPSPGHANELVELAGKADGFEYQPPAGHNKRVVVDMENEP